MLRLGAVIEKRQFRQGLALFLCLVLAACSRAGPLCQAPEGLPVYAVEAVTDGDTLRLRGGEKVRLIGINTPELGRDGRPPQALAREAKSALGELLAGGKVWLQDGEEDRDRYGRRLAHAFDDTGQNIAARLLRRGLGFQVAVAPNTAHVECLRGAEEEAANTALGVWAEPAYRPLAVAELRPSQGGFQRLRDVVTHVSFKDNGWWIQLGGKVGLRIRDQSQQLFEREALARLQGVTVEARGWLVPMRGDWWLMNLDHPALLQAEP